MTSERRIALITGASRGIGRAIAHELGRQGRIVIGTATSDDGAERIDADLREQGIEGAGRRLDVTDQASVDALVKAITDEFGAPTILVNNAGITRDNLLMRMKEDEWDSVLDTNLKSVYRVSKACIRGMTKARFGRIVSISSVVATMGNLGQTNYAAAKAGMEGFSRALAREVASRGDHRQCRGAGIHRYRHDRVAARVAASGTARADPVVSLGSARGDRCRGGLFDQRRCRLYHRRNVACQWRHEHALRSRSMPWLRRLGAVYKLPGSFPAGGYVPRGVTT